MIIKLIIYFFIFFSCGFNFLVRLQQFQMHNLYSKIIYDRVAQGKEGYPDFSELMDSLGLLTLIFSLIVLALTIALLFEKEFSRIEKILLLSVSVVSLLPHVVVV